MSKTTGFGPVWQVKSLVWIPRAVPELIAACSGFTDLSQAASHKAEVSKSGPLGAALREEHVMGPWIIFHDWQLVNGSTLVTSLLMGCAIDKYVK